MYSEVRTLVASIRQLIPESLAKDDDALRPIKSENFKKSRNSVPKHSRSWRLLSAKANTLLNQIVKCNGSPKLHGLCRRWNPAENNTCDFDPESIRRSSISVFPNPLDCSIRREWRVDYPLVAGFTKNQKRQSEVR
jgi:hypothetical protein